MTVRRDLAHLDDQGLGAALRGLGSQIEWPAADPIAPAVIGRLASQPTVRRLPFSDRSRRPLSRALLIAIAALLLIAAIATAIGLGVPGIRIIFGPGPTPTPTPTATVTAPSIAPSPSGPAPTPSPNPSSLGAVLGMGRLVSIDEARALADFPILQPSDPREGPPAEVWLDGAGSPAAVTQVWPAGAAGPAAPGTQIGLLLSEFRGSVQPDRIEKFLEPGTRMVPVLIARDVRGYWITGAPHEVVYFDPSGDQQSSVVRLAGNVLIWAEGDLTFRLETAGDVSDAVRIATSLK